MRLRNLAAAGAMALALTGLAVAPAPAEAGPKDCPRGYVCFWNQGSSKLLWRTDVPHKTGSVSVDGLYGKHIWAFNNGYEVAGADKVIARYRRYDKLCKEWGPVREECFDNNPQATYKGAVSKRYDIVLKARIVGIGWTGTC